MSLLDELSQAGSRVAAAAGPSVVRIGRDGRGAGAVVGTGMVLTSAHNLRGGEVTVTFADGRSVTGEVKAVDADGDLAAVSVDTAGVPPLEWTAGEDPSALLGAAVFALALPAASSGARVTFGTVSAVGRAFRGPRGRLISDAVEHTAPIGRGSSGGPLVDPEGRLVGVNTHRPGDGLYLALPATPALRARVEALGRGEAPTRRRLGVALTPPHVARRLRSAVGLPAVDGVLVRDVGEDTPASAAGIVRGDLIVAANGEPVASVDALLVAIDGAGEQASLRLSLVRGTENVDVEVSF
jgi:serine protease Do